MIDVTVFNNIVIFLTMIISAIREIVNPKVTQIAKCGSLTSTVIQLTVFMKCITTPKSS